MFNVFVSSTLEDLKSYRAEVCRLIGALGWHDIAMEKFPPAAVPPLTLIEEAIAQSEIYVGIIAWKYGARIEGSEGVSFTEYEFDLAGKLGKPRVVFLMDPDVPCLPALMDRGPDGESVESFRRRVSESSDITIKYFRKEIDLIQFLSGALLRIIQKSPKYQEISLADKTVLDIRQRIHADFVARRGETDRMEDHSQRDWFIKEISRCNIGANYIQRASVRKGMADWILRNQSPYLFVVGPAGVGKTNFLIMEIANFIIGAHSENQHSLLLVQAVLFMPVGSYKTEETFFQNLARSAGRGRYKEDVLRKLVENGSGLLIVDGLDEFVRNNDEDACFKLLEEIDRSIDTRKSKVLISCRDHIYRRLRTKKDFTTGMHCEVLNIKPLRSPAVKAALERRLGSNSPGYRIIASDENLTRFAQKPLILEMMCRISSDSWKKLLRTKSLGSLYDLWLEEIMSACSSSATIDEFVSETKLKVGNIAGLMLKKRSDLISEKELEDSGLRLEDLKALTQQPFGLFIKQTPVEWGFVHDSFREFSLAKTIELEFTSHDYDLLAKTSSFDYVGAETFAFLYDILPKSQEFLMHINSGLKVIQSNQDAWNNIVRNVFETIGMISETTEERFIDEAISILEGCRADTTSHSPNRPTVKTMYNLVRAIERMHHTSPMPYFRHVLSKGWENKPSPTCFGAVAVRGFRAPVPYPSSMPPMVYKKVPNKSDCYRQEDVSGLLIDLLSELQKNKWDKDLEFLEINTSYALIRWLHANHVDKLKRVMKRCALGKVSLGNLFQAFLRFADPSLFDNATELFAGMHLSWVYLDTRAISKTFKFVGTEFHRHGSSVFLGFHPSRFENCKYN